MIADIEKELGRLPLMSSRESTRVKTRKYLFQIDGGAVDFFKTRPPSERGCAAVLLPGENSIARGVIFATPQDLGDAVELGAFFKGF
jgi:hypothetical protein